MNIPDNNNHCPVCGGYNGPSDSLVTCAHCESQFYQVQNKQPEVLDYLMTDRTKYWRREARRIKKILGHEPWSHLDVGAGIGDFLSVISAVRRVGVETNEVVFKYLQTKHVGLKTIPDGNFEVITAYAVIEHMNDAGAVFDRLARQVSQGGVLAVMVPTLRVPMGKLRDNVHDSPPMHVAFPSEFAMDYYARRNGLRLVRRTYETGGTLPRYFKPKILAQIAGRLWDMSPLNRLPVADHIYSYWRKKR